MIYMRFGINLPGPFFVSFGNNGSSAREQRMTDSLQFHEAQHLLESAEAARARGEEKKARRFEKKADRRLRRLKRNYVNPEAWAQNTLERERKPARGRHRRTS